MVPFAHTLLSKSGKDLSLNIFQPDAAPKGIVQINTGTCIPQKIYWKFSDYLAAQGYITITYDYSDAHNYRSDVSHTAWIRDMESVFEFVQQTYPALKKIVVGHSSGGQLIGYMPGCEQIDKIVLVASSNGYIKNLSLPMQLMMRFFWNIVVPYSIRKYGYMNNRLFGTGGGFPKQIILELRSWCFDKDFFIPWFKAQNVESHYDKITAPLVAYHLADDVIANEKSCRYIFNLYSNAQKVFKTLYAKKFDMKKFGHRGFFDADAEKLLWPEFIKELEH